MKTLFAVLALVSSFAPAPVRAASAQEHHGGDAMSAEFVDVARQLVKTLRLLPPYSLPSEDFPTRLERAIERTEVRTVSRAFLGSREVDAINYPAAKPPRIKLSRARWGQLPLDISKKQTLVLHEYLSILRIPDSAYETSNPLIRGVRFQSSRLSVTERVYRAVGDCDVLLAREMIEDGADLQIKGPKGNTLLHVAAQVACTPLVEYLLGKGLQVEDLSLEGWSPLFAAVYTSYHHPWDREKQEEYLLTVRTLISAGARPGRPAAITVEWDGEKVVGIRQSPLMRAIIGIEVLGMTRWTNVPLIRVLAESAGEEIQARDGYGLSAAQYAGRLNHPEVTEILNRLGAR